jgi:hypothetical protein
MAGRGSNAIPRRQCGMALALDEQPDQQGISRTADVEQPHLRPWATVLSAPATVRRDVTEEDSHVMRYYQEDHVINAVRCNPVKVNGPAGSASTWRAGWGAVFDGNESVATWRSGGRICGTSRRPGASSADVAAGRHNDARNARAHQAEAP